MELNESKRLNCFSCSVELINDYIFEFEIDTKLVFISKAWKKLLGFSEFEMPNSFAGLCNLVINAPRFKEDFENFAYGDETVLITENQYRCKDGNIKWFKQKAKKICFNSKPDTLRIVVFYTDVTDLKELQLRLNNELSNKDALINTTNDFIFSIDRKFNLTAANNTYLSSHQCIAVNPPFAVGNNVIKHLKFTDRQKTLWLNCYKRAFNGESFTIEHNQFLVTDVNENRWFENTFNPIYRASKIIGVAVYCKNISDRKLAEEALTNSEQRFRYMFRQHSAKMLIIDPATLDIIDANDAAVKFYGYPYERFFRMNLSEICPLPLADMKALYSLDGKLPKEKIILPHRISTGKMKTVQVLPSVIEASNKKLFFFIVIDVTDKEIAENLLKVERDTFQSIVKALPDIVSILDDDNRYVYVHSNKPANLLMPEAAYIGKHMREVLPHEVAIQLEDKISEAKLTGLLVKLVYSLELPALGTRWFESRIIENSGHGILDIVRDVTEQKIAGEAIRKSNERYDLASKATSDGIYDWDIVRDEVFFSEGYKSLFELNADTNVDVFKEWQIKLHEEERADVLESLTTALYSKSNKWAKEYRYKKGNGEYVNASDKGYIIRDDAGRPIRMVGALSDITSFRKSESLLKESLHVLKTSQEVANVGSFIFDIESGSFSSTEIFDAIVGLDSNATKTYNNFLDQVIPSFKKVLDNEFQQALRDKKNLSIKFQIVRLCDSQIRWINVFGQHAFDKYTNKLNFIGAVQDITERENLIEERERILESITDYFYVIDNDLNFLYCNKSALSFFNCTAQEIFGKNIFDILPELANTVFKENLLKAIINQQDIDFELCITERGGWHEQHFYPFSGGCTCIFKSINNRKIVEKELLKSNLQLAIRTEELINSNIELERFAYVASHDLQEPLRIISSFLQLFEKKYKDVVDEKGKKYIDFAVGGAWRMKNLIRDLLQYSRVGSNILEIAAVDMNEIVQDVLQVYKKDINGINAIINADRLPVIDASKNEMLQVMQNLVENAIKYCGKSNVVITISCQENETEWVFSVKDNGVGIDPKFSEKIFVVFQRLYSKEDYSGSGIGLSICKKIIEKHKGQIWVNSIMGQGAEFLFSIPKSQQV